MDENEFVCDVCGRKFTKLLSDIEALEQYMRENPKSFAAGDAVVYACPPCHAKFQAWVKEKGIEL